MNEPETPVEDIHLMMQADPIFDDPDDRFPNKQDNPADDPPEETRRERQLSNTVDALRAQNNRLFTLNADLRSENTKLRMEVDEAEDNSMEIERLRADLDELERAEQQTTEKLVAMERGILLMVRNMGGLS